MSMNRSFFNYIFMNILRELDVIDLRIKTLPESSKKDAARIKSNELRTIIEDIKNEVNDNDHA